MEMLQGYIDSFENKDGQIIFEGCYAFSKGEKHLLLGENGNIIILNEALYQKIIERDMDDDLWFKLLQRKLAVHKQNPKATEQPQFQIRPTYFMIDMTSRCNMGCKYCLRDSEKSLESKVINEETIIKICRYIEDYCRKNDIDQVYIQPWGGEPLLEKEKIFLIQKEMTNSGIRVNISIETNGLLLSDSLIKELYDRKIGYGISIDGFAEVHDRQRTLTNGTATHERVEHAVKNTQKYYGEDTSVLATVTKQSVPYLREIVEYFAKCLGLKKIKINFVHKSVFQKDDSFCVDNRDIETGTEQIFDTIISLNECNIDIMEYNLWVKMMNILTNRKMDACISRGCSGGRNMITFDTKGNIFPCDVTDFPEERMGNISESLDLNEMIEKAIKIKSYFAEKKSEECLKCPWKHFCNGGCTVHVKCAGEEPGGIDQIECSANKTVYPKIIELILEKPQLVNHMIGYEIL